MESKRLFGVLLLSLVLISMFSVGVVGADDDTGTDPSNAITFFVDKYLVGPGNEIIKYLVGDSQTGELMLVKFLFLILITMIGYYGASKVPGIQNSKILIWLVSFIVGILGTRYLTTPELIKFAWLPSGVLGMVLMTLLPFVIFLFAIERVDNSLVRKIGWIAYTVIFFGLAGYRWDELAIKQGGKFFGIVIENSSVWANLGWLYVLIAVFSLVAIYFDKKIRARIMVSSLTSPGSGVETTKIVGMREEIKNKQDALANAADDQEHEKIQKEMHLKDNARDSINRIKRNITGSGK